MNNWVENYIYGAMSGSIAAFVSHPAFNWKTVIQKPGGVVTKEMYTNPKWLYAGVTRAMVGYGFEKMAAFGTFYSLRENGVHTMIAGAASGVAAAFCSTVTEQLMIDKAGGVSCFKFKHLYSGFAPTLLREVLGFTVHFTVYETFSDRFNKDKEFFKTIICGTVATISGWTFVTPIDRVKTLVQTGKFNLKTYNFMHSFHGFTPAIVRAVPFHVTVFLSMEWLKKQTSI